MSSVEITRRRALVALATVGVGSAAAGAGTYSAFSDSGTDSGSFTAGTLNLTVGGSQTLSFSAGNIKPGDSGSSFVDLSPSGTLTGDLDVEVTGVTLTNDGGETSDNLDQHLDLQIWLDQGGTDDGTIDSGDIGLLSDGTTGSGSASFAKVANYDATSWTDAITGMSNDWTFHVDWQFPDDGTNINNAQGDSVTVDFKFTLNQQ